MIDANLGSGSRPIAIQPEDHQDFVDCFNLAPEGSANLRVSVVGSPSSSIFRGPMELTDSRPSDSDGFAWGVVVNQHKLD